MKRKRIIFITYIVTAFVLLEACNYKPPYDRGYAEGYQAGYTAAGGEASDSPEAQAASDSQTSVTPEVPEKSHLLSMVSKSDDEGAKADKDSADGGDEASAESDEAADTSADDTAEADTSAESTGESEDPASGGDQESQPPEGAEVLGNGSQPSAEEGGNQGSAIPEGRIIAADAVNEALYSHPEVIDGLRQIYADTTIFGEYVGDSETHLLHKVNGPHFAELGYDTIVVFDGSKSVQDILNEGFYTKCSCIDQ